MSGILQVLMDDPAVRKQMLPLLPITLLGVAVDLWLRPTLDLRLTQWAWWGLSVAFSLVMWQGLFAISSRLRPRWQAAFVIVVGLVTLCAGPAVAWLPRDILLLADGLRARAFGWPSTRGLGVHPTTKPIGGTRSSG